MIQHFDTSQYDETFGIPKQNKKVLLKMKDENSHSILTEFVGQRTNMYALRTEKEAQTKKSKGVKQ